MTTRISAIIIGIAATIATSLTATAKTYSNTDINDADYDKLDNAISLVDNGESLRALPTYDALPTKYPDNYLVNYEYCYALYRLERYEQAAELASDLCESAAATELTHQMLGKSLAKAGRTDEAIAAYRRGIEAFPYAAELNAELGDLLHLQDLDAEALASFNNGIATAPTLPANYYCAAKLYLDSADPVWGMIYAETEVLITPKNRATHREMMDLYARALNSRIEAGVACREVPAIRQTPGEKAFINFTVIYDACESIGLNSLAIDSDSYQGSIQQMADVRRATLDTYLNTASDLYGDAMQLLSYQKSVIDAGHWDAYNNFLFAPVRPEEAIEWRKAHEDEYYSFVAWFHANPLTLDYAHTVGANDIFRDFAPLTASEVAQLQNDFDAYSLATDLTGQFAKN